MCQLLASMMPTSSSRPMPWTRNWPTGFRLAHETAEKFHHTELASRIRKLLGGAAADGDELLKGGAEDIRNVKEEDNVKVLQKGRDSSSDESREGGHTSEDESGESSDDGDAGS